MRRSSAAAVGWPSAPLTARRPHPRMAVRGTEHLPTPCSRPRRRFAVVHRELSGPAGPLPDGFTLQHYGTVQQARRRRFITTTLLYCRASTPARLALSIGCGYRLARAAHEAARTARCSICAAMSALAVPTALVLGIGILRAYFDVQLPGGASLATSLDQLLTIVPWLQPYGACPTRFALQRRPACSGAPERSGKRPRTWRAGELANARRASSSTTAMAGGTRGRRQTPAFATAAVELRRATLVLCLARGLWTRAAVPTASTSLCRAQRAAARCCAWCYRGAGCRDLHHPCPRGRASHRRETPGRRARSGDLEGVM